MSCASESENPVSTAAISTNSGINSDDTSMHNVHVYNDNSHNDNTNNSIIARRLLLVLPMLFLLRNIENNSNRNTSNTNENSSLNTTKQ